MRILLASALALAATTARAAPPAWTVDKAHSKLGFTATVGGQAVAGGFSRWDAQIAFDPADLAGSHIVVTVDPASAATGDRTRDEALPTGDWFGVKTFARATFASKSITPSGPGRYVAHGALTIRNVARPADLPFTLTINGAAANASGGLVLDRRSFGLGQGQFKETGMVAAEVKVAFSLAAARAK